MQSLFKGGKGRGGLSLRRGWNIESVNGQGGIFGTIGHLLGHLG